MSNGKEQQARISLKTICSIYFFPFSYSNIWLEQSPTIWKDLFLLNLKDSTFQKVWIYLKLSTFQIFIFKYYKVHLWTYNHNCYNYNYNYNLKSYISHLIFHFWWIQLFKKFSYLKLSTSKFSYPNFPCFVHHLIHSLLFKRTCFRAIFSVFRHVSSCWWMPAPRG